jgi:hypothetical protein
VLHIHHFFVHPSLSDSNLPSDSPLNAQISALFQGTLPEPRAKIAAQRVKIENGPTTFPSFANNLASSVFIQHDAGKFSRFDGSSLACGVH